MTLLLDTHTFLWWLEGNRKLGRRARATIGAAESAVWVSAATAWEIAIKMGLGRLTLREPPETCLPREIRHSGFQTLAISVAHALAVRTLPLHHADPFDRLLVAQAEAEGMTLVTADTIFEHYGVPTLDARE
jgi:PIN domain nuclease of toxin-antitoxin system